MSDAPATPAVTPAQPAKHHWWQNKALDIKAAVTVALAGAAAFIATKMAQKKRR